MLNQTQTNRFDENRGYAGRCPSCKRFMNIAGVTLNKEKYIKCWNCRALGSTTKWIAGGQICH